MHRYFSYITFTCKFYNITNHSNTVKAIYNIECRVIHMLYCFCLLFYRVLISHISLVVSNWMQSPQTATPYGIEKYWPADHKGYSSINQWCDECVYVSISIVHHLSAVLGLELRSTARLEPNNLSLASIKQPHKLSHASVCSRMNGWVLLYYLYYYFKSKTIAPEHGLLGYWFLHMLN